MIKKTKGILIGLVKKVGLTLMAVETFGMAVSAGSLDKLKVENSTFKPMLTFIAGWTTFLGAAIAFLGAVRLASAFRSENPMSKEKGLRGLVAGLIVIGIALSVDQFLNLGN